MKKCFIFDFDCTITYSHYYYYRNNIEYYKKKWANVLKMFNIDANALFNLSRENIWSPFKVDIINLFFGGEQRLNYIRAFFDAIRNNGYDIYISSRGNYAEILELLIFLDLDRYIKDINAAIRTRESLRYKNMSKIMFVDCILQEKYDKIIYVDDNNDEHLTIIRNPYINTNNYKFYGENVGLHKDGNGLSIASMQQIYLEMVA